MVLYDCTNIDIINFLHSKMSVLFIVPICTTKYLLVSFICLFFFVLLVFFCCYSQRLSQIQTWNKEKKQKNWRHKTGKRLQIKMKILVLFKLKALHSLHCYINAGKSTEILYFRVYGTSTGICCIFLCLVCCCHLFKFHDYFQLNKITRTSSNFNFINTSRQVEVYFFYFMSLKWYCSWYLFHIGAIIKKKPWKYSDFPIYAFVLTS